jgi:RHS repeat-associated protein
MPSNVRFATNGIFNESIQYKYDSMGNIVEIFENGRSTCRYEYDALGRLTREDNVAFGKTTTWAYDNNGNIIARYEYAITAKPTNELHLLNGTCKLYTYDDNSDQLMSYNGESFEYDVIGNPTIYRGKAATWVYGRQLSAYDGNTFTYDAHGRRTGKNTITFTYDSNGNLIKQSNGLEFLYDHSGVFAVKYNNATYFYRKNAQNDIIALLDNNGTVVVKYKYDAWGKCVVDASTTNTTLANLNPFRYRSYYFDTETGFYFLKTRYYDPEIGRFMTIDDLAYLDPDSINGLNLYAYCGNNPVMGYDPNGTWDWGTFWRSLGSTLAIAGGIALCFVPGAQAIGAGLIIAGAGGLIGGAIGHATGYGFNAGWDIGTVIGGFIGLAVAAPQLIGLTFNASIPFLAPMLTTAGELVLVGTTVSVAIPVGGAIAVAAGAGLIMFASDNRPKNNQVQNKQFRKAAEEAGFNPKDPDDMDVLNEIHQYIRDNGLDLGWKKLVELMKQWRW